MTYGFKNEGVQRQKECADLEAKMRTCFQDEATKMVARFKNEKTKRGKFQKN